MTFPIFPVPKVSRDFNNLSFGDMRRMPSDLQAKRSVVNACNLRPRSDRRRRLSDHCRRLGMGHECAIVISKLQVISYQ